MGSESQRAKWRKQKEVQKRKDPEKYAWQSLKNNVFRRNRERRKIGRVEIRWALSLEDFREFCYRYDYMRKKGQKSESMTIDRIKEGDEYDGVLGYCKDNIRPLSNGDNVRKMLMLKYDWDEEKKEMVYWHCKEAVFSSEVLLDENGEVIF